MRRQALEGSVMMAAIAFSPLVADAGLIPDRATLDEILGEGGVFEDFESYVLSDGDAHVLEDEFGDHLISLDSTTIAFFDEAPQGPGLVMPGAKYTTGTGFGGMQWNGNDWVGGTTRSLLGNNVYTEITYTDAVMAMGVDVGIYEGFGADHRALVFDTSDNLLGLLDFVMNGDPGERFFFGWEDAGGIGRVEIHDLGNSWGGIIDDHRYGIPVPGALAMLGVAGLFGARRRRERAQPSAAKRDDDRGRSRARSASDRP